MFRKICTIMAGCICIFSCSKENSAGKAFLTKDQSQKNSFVFGYYYLFRLPYANVYKLEDKQVFADAVDSYYEQLVFSAQPLSYEKYTIAKQIEERFPAFLESNTDSTYGMPNAYDQGIIHLEKTSNGVKRSWIIDPDTANLPGQLKTYISSINEAILQLKE